MHTFATIQSLAPAYAGMAKVAIAYKTNVWNLDALAIHPVGHGAANCWCGIPSGPGKFNEDVNFAHSEALKYLARLKPAQAPRIRPF